MKKFNFSKSILDWYDKAGRKDLPWQKRITPYRVWISEIMLQQTQVATVIPYYLKFMESFPSIKILSAASLEKVLHHWSGLGYYARARNLHKMSRIVDQQFNGNIPLNFDELIKLPGIGRSTAGAILALSDNQKYAILDGNVKRVLSRFHAIKGWPGKRKTENTLWELSCGHLPEDRVASYTQAMMDLGATVCVRANPKCQMCPIKSTCIAHARSEENVYPHKKKMKNKPHRTVRVVLLLVKNKVLLEQRPASGIWGGLSSLPELREDEHIEKWCKRRFKMPPIGINKQRKFRHAFSHYTLDIEPIEVRVDDASCKLKLNSNEYWYMLNRPAEVGLAAPVKKLLQNVS